MAPSPLPSAFIENEFLRVDYLTTTGPRITGLYVKEARENLFAEIPEVHFPTPHGEYYLRGGHRLWTAPEDPFYICPEGNIDVISDNGKVVLRSNIDASGLQKEISFHLDENCVSLTHRVTWCGEGSIELAPWGITQLRLGGMAILPQSEVGRLQPNRNVVFWPYSRIEDERLELHNDLILIHGQASEQALKIGSYNSLGWAACLWDRVLFVKRFPVDPIRAYPDMGCNTEVYVRDVCLELETLGPLKILNPTESVTHEEIWEVRVEEFSTTREDARIISKQLS